MYILMSMYWIVSIKFFPLFQIPAPSGDLGKAGVPDVSTPFIWEETVGIDKPYPGKTVGKPSPVNLGQGGCVDISTPVGTLTRGEGRSRTL